jgi:hypothetical protein
MARRGGNPTVARSWALTFLLLPGIFFQWLMYTFPQRGRIWRDTRIARSTVMSWVFSAVFYLSLWFVFTRLWRW